MGENTPNYIFKRVYHTSTHKKKSLKLHSRQKGLSEIKNVIMVVMIPFPLFIVIV